MRIQESWMLIQKSMVRSQCSELLGRGGWLLSRGRQRRRLFERRRFRPVDHILGQRILAREADDADDDVAVLGDIDAEESGGRLGEIDRELVHVGPAIVYPETQLATRGPSRHLDP